MDQNVRRGQCAYLLTFLTAKQTVDLGAIFFHFSPRCQKCSHLNNLVFKKVLENGPNAV